MDDQDDLWDITLIFRLNGKGRSMKLKAWELMSAERGSHMWYWEDGRLYHPGGSDDDPSFMK